MRYDAFISYRHGELDGFVAEKLHKMLETYRIPGPIAKKVGKKKLARVFRDREELPTSSNLSDSINDALENSAFLLLICSKRTCASQWVMREVERFGELHGKDKIITLLIDGEPDEAFPPGLRERKVGSEIIFVEPLAADIRAETWEGSVKLLKEEKLRLLAPVLGCAYDDLRRRHRQRRIRRVASGVGAALAFSLSFGGFSTWQYWRIDREMQLKLKNQSYVLAEYSREQFSAGDPDTAMLLALAGLPQSPGDPERPLVAAPQRALTEALGLYDLKDGYKPHKLISLPVAPSKLALSPGEAYGLAVYPFELLIFNPATGEIAAALPTVSSALADAEFLSDSVVVYAGENGVTAYDITSQTLIWQGEPATDIAVSYDKSVVAAVYKDAAEAVIYSAAGEKTGAASFNGKAMRVPADDTFLDPHDALFELSGDGSGLAVSFADGSLSLFDTKAGSETVLYEPSRAIHFSGGFSGEALAFAAVEAEPFAYALRVHDEAGEQVASYASEASRFIPFAGLEGIWFAVENQVMRLDMTTGEVSYAAAAGGRIEAFAQRGGEFLICEAGGTYRFTGEKYAREYASEYVCGFPVLGGRFALTGGYDSNAVRVLRREENSAADILKYDLSYEFSEAKINPGNGRAAFYSYRGLRLCDLNGNIIAETDFPDPEVVVNTEYDKASGNIAVLYSDKFKLYSGLDGSLLLEIQGESPLYTRPGISVIGQDGAVTLYGFTGEAIAAWQSRELAAGEIVGGALNADGSFSVAVADYAGGKVFNLAGGVATEIFTFETRGRTEAYFCGGYVFISPLHGGARAYTAEGRLVRAFDESGYLAEVEELGEYIAAHYVSSANERYAFLLTRGTLETIAALSGCLGELEPSVPVLDVGGSLRRQKLHSLNELVSLAHDRLGARVLTPQEEQAYNAG